MKTVAAKLYEGMFMVDSALAASDWQGVNDTIRSILEKFDADIVSIHKWDERKLAYDIRGKGRGTYILAYFRVDGPKVTEIERAIQLSENIIRALVLCVEDLDERYITKKPPAAGELSRAPDDIQESPQVEDDQTAPAQEAETADDEQALHQNGTGQAESEQETKTADDKQADFSDESEQKVQQ